MLLSLGIPLKFLNKKRIIEFCPGTGDNAVVTSHGKPLRYTLVDGNTASVTAIQDRIKKGVFDKDVSYQIIKSDLFKVTPEQTGLFDLVICEGASAQNNPLDFYKHCASFVEKGGIMIATSADIFSTFSELLRQGIHMARTNFSVNKINKSEISAFCSLFEPHLNSLPGVSRGIEDWVLDLITHPRVKTWSLDILSLSKFITEDSDFENLGYSPNLFYDLNWYKTKSLPSYNHIDNIDAQMTVANILNLDKDIKPYNLCRELDPIELNRISDEIKNIISSISDNICNSYELDDRAKICSAINHNIQELCEILPDSDSFIQIKNSCIEYSKVYKKIKNGCKISDLTNLNNPYLINWWGRGQQYLSFSRQLFV